MALLDKLRSMAAADPNANLLEFLGVGKGGRFQIDAKTMTVGDETVTLAEAKLAIQGGPIVMTPAARRTVEIADLR